MQLPARSFLSFSLLFPQFFLLLVISLPVFAGKYDDGLKAYNSEDYATAIALWTSAEMQNDPRALFGTASLYMQGLGVVRDRKKAVELYQQSAKLGHVSSQFNLGLAYANGRGVDQNTERAIAWWGKAANAGHGAAQYNVAMLLWSGHGVPQDQASAMNWFRKSLANGNTQSRTFLYGLFAPMQNELTEDDALYRSANTIRKIPLTGEKDMYVQAQQAMSEGDYDQALNLWLALAEDGHSESKYMIGNLYENGQGVKTDFGKALIWYDKAAKLGQPDAQYRLALYHINEALDKNKSLGLYWMQSAADNNFSPAIEYMKNGG